MAISARALRRSTPLPDPEQTTAAPVAATRPWWFPFTLAVGVLALGALRAGDHGMWRDEAVSAALIDRPWSALVRILLGEEANMAPYYVLLKLWSSLGDSDGFLRMLSVALGALATAVLAAWAAPRFGRPVAVLAAALAVTNPFFLRYLTEARSVTMAMACSVIATVAFDRLLRGGGRRWAVGYGVAVGLAFGASAVAVLVVPAHLVAAVVARVPLRELVGRLWVAAVPAAVLGGPGLVALTAGTGQVDWIPPLSVRVVLDETLLVLGRGIWGPVPGLPAAAAAAAGLAVAVLLCAAQSGRPGAHARRPDHALVLVVATALVPVVLLLGVSVVRPLYIGRYLAPSFPFVALAAAFGLVEVARGLRIPARVTALLVAVAVTGPFVVTNPLSDEARLDDVAALATDLRRELRDGDVVVFADSWMRTPLARYLRLADRHDPEVGAWPDHRLYPDLRSLPEAERRLGAATRVLLVTLPFTDPAAADPLAASVMRADGAAWAPVERRSYGLLDLAILEPA